MRTSGISGASGWFGDVAVDDTVYSFLCGDDFDAQVLDHLEMVAAADALGAGDGAVGHHPEFHGYDVFPGSSATALM